MADTFEGWMKLTLGVFGVVVVAMIVTSYTSRSPGPACNALDGAQTLGAAATCEFESSDRKAALAAATTAAVTGQIARWSTSRYEGAFRALGAAETFAGETCRQVEHVFVVKETGEKRTSAGTMCKKG